MEDSEMDTFKNPRKYATNRLTLLIAKYVMMIVIAFRVFKYNPRDIATLDEQL